MIFFHVSTFLYVLLPLIYMIMVLFFTCLLSFSLMICGKVQECELVSEPHESCGRKTRLCMCLMLSVIPMWMFT